MNSNRKIFLLLAVWCLWLTAEMWIAGPHSYLFIHDNADQEVPNTIWLTHSLDRVLHEQIMPSSCGVARMPSSNFLIYWQPLFMLFPPWMAYGLALFIQRLVAAWFAHLCARDLFKLPLWLSVGAGLIYPLLPLEHGEARLMHMLNEPGMPLLLYCFWRLPAAHRLQAGLWGLLLGLVAGLAMSPVDSIPFLLPSMVVAAWLLREDRSSPRVRSGFLFACLLCGMITTLLKLPLLLGMATHAAESHRAGWTAGAGFLNDFFFNLLESLRYAAPLWPFALLSVYLLCKLRRNNPVHRCLLFLLVLAFLVGPVVQAAAWNHGGNSILLKGINFMRFKKIMPFVLLLGALTGLHQLLQKRGETFRCARLLPWLGLASIASLCVSASWQQKLLHLDKMHRGWTWKGLYGNPALSRVAKTLKPEEPFRCATAGAYHEFHPLFLLASGLETADGYAVIYPRRYNLYWRQVLRPLLRAEPESAGYFTEWGSRTYLFHSMRPEHAALPEIRFAEWYDLDLLSLANVRYLVSQKPIADPRLHALPPVWDALTRGKWAELPLLKKLPAYLSGTNPGPPLFLYENPAHFPRFFTAGGTRIIPGYEVLGDASLEELRSSVYLLREDAGQNAEAPPWNTSLAGTVKIHQYSPGASELTASMPQEGWVVQSTLWYPQSRCWINGREVKPVPAYGAFQAIRVPAGESRIQWRIL